MVEIAISVAAKVVEFLVGPIARPFSYIWNYKTNFDNLKTEVRKLEGQKETVQDSVDSARRNGDQIKQRVSDWLVSVEKITDEASEVIEENQQANMKCFKGLCPNPKRHYQHSRKAVKKAKAIVELYADGNFQTVSIQTNPEEIWIPSYKGYMVFESRMSTLKDILDALSNPDVNRVGIYGTGGIGKTTLAREIAGQAEDKNLFNVVAFAEVAMKPDIKEIQQEIAVKLGLTFREESASGRARSLQQRLKQEEKVLLVLDNIWERLNLEDVGIPFGNDHKGCKLLLTARSLDVLSNKMDSQSNFKVDFLEKGEAWSLFEKKAGACDRLQALAKNVAEACGGLPIAINSVAVALKTKEEFEWKDALRKLTKPSASNFEGVAAETYSSIEISYSQLKEEELKSTFLLCCMMGYYANVEDLLAYGMGLGMFKYVEAMEDARNRVNTLVRKLKDSSLLLDINNGTFSLHDVVRDVGRSIASRDGHMFTVTNNCIPREWEDKDIVKNCVGISLYNINKLPEEFECPELRFFFVRTTNVPNNFFAGMPKLKVLHLAGLELNSVPNSIRLLVNLRTLYIYDCELWDVDFIGEFKQLEILRIYGSYPSSEIEMIPKKMCNLTGLRLLDLSGCSIIRNIPPNVLSTFTRLEELYLPAGVFRKCKIEWEVEGVNILDELKHLMHLTTLKISIADANVLPKGCFLLKKLERYEIIIGNIGRSSFYRRNGTSRMVQLNLESSSCSDDVQKFLSVLDGRGFPELEYLHVENSPCFRAIVDCLESESCHHFLSLQSLILHSVLNLEMIHNYPLKADSFRQLRTITVANCNKLKNIFSFSTYKALPLLQEVDVSSCDNMEEIFAIRREKDINNIEGTDQIEFKHLSSLRLNNLPKLTSFYSINNNEDMLDTPTLLFNQKVVFPNLQTLDIYEIHVEKIWHNFPPTVSSCVQNLTKLVVSSCGNLKELFSCSTRVAKESREEKRRDTILFPKLNCLWVGNLAKLTSLWSGYYIEFPTLKEFGIGSCPELEAFIFDDKVKVPSLEKMEIFYMDNLKMIWHNQLDEDSFRKLKSLEVNRCQKLLTVFPSNILGRFLSMESLNVRKCGSLEEIFNVQGMISEERNYVAATQSRDLLISNLQELKVTECQSLKYLFAGSIVSKKERDRFLFPKLTSLKLCKLPELRTFYPGRHTVEGPVLKRLELCDCGIHIDTDEDGLMQMQQPLSLVEKAFPVLEELILAGKELMMMWQGQVPECLFHKLKILTVQSDESAVLPLGIIQRFQYLDMLLLSYGSYEQIFSYGEDQTQAATPAKMKKLVLHYLGSLKYMWKQDFKLDLILQNLEVLRVIGCYSLINLMPSSASFQNLTILEVYDCDSLENIVTSSIAKSLVKLIKMSLWRCTKITEVIGNQGDVTGDKIVFNNLKNLSLEESPSLTSFCSGNITLEFPSLEELNVTRCPKMEIFSRGVLTTEKLRKIEIDGKSVKLYGDVDLNMTIQQFLEKVIFRNDNRASSSHHLE